MRHLPVHWSEGMFLRPQHFQTAERYWAEQVHVSQLWNNHYHYGLRSIQLSEQALANYQIEVTECQARMRDGTLVSAGAEQPLDRVDLRPAFEKESVVMVYLAVPKLAMGRANVAVNAGDGDAEHRYSETVLAQQDESRGGGDQGLGEAIHV